ncbi:MAG: hypothetical protein HWE23_04935 [Rhodobacteraceae bacterium]|nr:hypothetical protein [Paracoccaceae bacterium]
MDRIDRSCAFSLPGFRQLIQSLLLAIVVSTTSASAQEGNTADMLSPGDRSAMTSVTNGIAYLTLHHAMTELAIDDFGLAVPADDESSIDKLVIAQMLDQHDVDDDALLGDTLLALSFLERDFRDPQAQILGAHTPDDIKNMMCQIIGARPDLKATLSGSPDLGQDCVTRAAQSMTTWRDLIKDHRAGDTNTGSELQDMVRINLAAADHANEHDHDHDHDQMAHGQFDPQGVFDQVAKDLRQTYRLERPVSLLLANCDAPSAFFNKDKRVIVLCEGLLNNVAMLYRAKLLNGH